MANNENNGKRYDELIKNIMDLTLEKIKEKQDSYTFVISRYAIERLVQFELAYTAQQYFNVNEKWKEWKAYIDIGLNCALPSEQRRFDIVLSRQDLDLKSLKKTLNNKGEANANSAIIIIELKANQGPVNAKTGAKYVGRNNANNDPLTTVINDIKKKLFNKGPKDIGDVCKLKKFLKSYDTEKYPRSYALLFVTRLKGYEDTWHNRCKENGCSWCCGSIEDLKNKIKNEIGKLKHDNEHNPIPSNSIQFRTGDDYEGAFFIAFKVNKDK